MDVLLSIVALENANTFVEEMDIVVEETIHDVQKEENQIVLIVIVNGHLEKNIIFVGR